LEVAAVPHYGFDESNWWQSEDGLITLNNETIKLAYYFLKYR
ncbi:MAG: YdcF family protein, partial [Chloroflexi bacterium CG_4_10_14_0_8_um_filter_57_5]